MATLRRWAVVLINDNGICDIDHADVLILKVVR
jgi:hypothetical protein